MKIQISLLLLLAAVLALAAPAAAQPAINAKDRTSANKCQYLLESRLHLPGRNSASG
jgi:hypothetical protein